MTNPYIDPSSEDDDLFEEIDSTLSSLKDSNSFDTKSEDMFDSEKIINLGLQDNPNLGASIFAALMCDFAVGDTLDLVQRSLSDFEISRKRNFVSTPSEAFLAKEHPKYSIYLQYNAATAALMKLLPATKVLKKTVQDLSIIAEVLSQDQDKILTSLDAYGVPENHVIKNLVKELNTDFLQKSSDQIHINVLILERIVSIYFKQLETISKYYVTSAKKLEKDVDNFFLTNGIMDSDSVDVFLDYHIIKSETIENVNSSTKTPNYLNRESI